MQYDEEKLNFRHLRFDMPYPHPPSMAMEAGLQHQKKRKSKRMTFDERMNKYYYDKARDDKVLSPVGAVTLAYSPDLNVVTMSMCDARDKFCRKTGRKYATERMNQVHGMFDVDEVLHIFVPDHRPDPSTFYGNQLKHILDQVIEWAVYQAKRAGNYSNTFCVSHLIQPVAKD